MKSECNNMHGERIKIKVLGLVEVSTVSDIKCTVHVAELLDWLCETHTTNCISPYYWWGSWEDDCRFAVKPEN